MEDSRYFGIYPASATTVPEGTRPVVLVDDKLYSLADLTNYKAAGSFAFVGSCNEKSIEVICKSLDVEAVLFSEMRVKDLDVLVHLGDVAHLGIDWNTKVNDLSFLRNFPSLKSLILSDTPKVSDLKPISALKELVLLDFSGGIWNKNRAISLHPLESLSSLETLCLSNIKVDDGSLAPVAKLSSLRSISLSNQFKTQEYAFLKTMLPNTRCEKFAPYVKLQSPIDGKDVMVVGARKPFLNSQTDAKRLEKYVAQFEKLVGKFEVQRNAT